MLFLINSSCGKNDNDDKESPVITLSQPLENQSTILNGDSVHVLLSASDNIELKNLQIELKTNSGNIWFSAFPDVAGKKFYSYHKHYNPVNLSGSTSLTLTVTTADKKGNTASKIILFTVAP
ncbi:MAG: DUF4625 domain-containing protein [Chitinophagaceae bacterium]|nr:DUF4625 domain-containing protein [Chitinophagaceae bacterium]